MRILRVYFNGRDARATFSNSITTRLNRCSGKARLMDSAARYRSFRNARRQIDDFPGRAVAQQRRHERGVQQVTASLSLDSTEDRHSKQGQVTNDVENLVTNEVIGKTKTGFVFPMNSFVTRFWTSLVT